MFAQVLSQSCILKHCNFETVISLSYVDSHTKNIVFDYVESTIKSIKENDNEIYETLTCIFTSTLKGVPSETIAIPTKNEPKDVMDSLWTRGAIL